MSVVNVTPDSFSDGGEHFAPEAAVAHAHRMLDEGADIIDIGGESTRPGASVRADDAPRNDGVVSAEEELRRVLPVIQGVLHVRPDALISVDTYKAEVARTAVAQGAEIVNDVSGLRWDSAMAATCAELGCGVVLMHTRGTPKEWRTLPIETNIVSLVEHDLANRLQVAFERGLGADILCSIRDSASVRTSKRTIRYWRISSSCSGWVSHCWREPRARGSSGERSGNGGKQVSRLLCAPLEMTKR